MVVTASPGATDRDSISAILHPPWGLIRAAIVAGLDGILTRYLSYNNVRWQLNDKGGASLAGA